MQYQDTTTAELVEAFQVPQKGADTRELFAWLDKHAGRWTYNHQGAVELLDDPAYATEGYWFVVTPDRRCYRYNPFDFNYYFKRVS